MTRASEVIEISSPTHRDCGVKGGIVDASKEKSEKSNEEKSSQEKEALALQVA